MPTPSIQTLVNNAQAVLALQNMTTIRSTLAVALANANTGTPLNPGLTNQQLIDEARQVMTLPKSDIESIIVNQLMKFLNSPPAPGGVGADKQVIWNDAGVLTGDPNFTWDGPLSLLKVTGAATITGDLTVRTNKLAVTSTGVGVNYTTPAVALHVGTTGATNKFCINTAVTNAGDIQLRRGGFIGFSNAADNTNSEYLFANGGALEMGIAGTTAMTLNSTGNLVLKGGTAGANGVGITFPATQVASSDANCLDDYEEGTFVATLRGFNVEPATKLTATCIYTKVGRLVNVVGDISGDTTGYVGVAYITGLPFVTGAACSGAANGNYIDLKTRTSLASVAVNADTAVYFLAVGSTVGTVYAEHNAGAGRSFSFNITYTV